MGLADEVTNRRRAGAADAGAFDTVRVRCGIGPVQLGMPDFSEAKDCSQVGREGA
jgi:hypothetical protein